MTRKNEMTLPLLIDTIKPNIGEMTGLLGSGRILIKTAPTR
jgi:hypothetical protein